MKKSILVLILLKYLAVIGQPTITWKDSAWSDGVPTDLTFNNRLRVVNTASQLFKTSQVAVENNRVYLNAKSSAGDFGQMAINYVTGATNGVDDFDATYFNEATLALNSVINNVDYAIQGRALPFDPTDLVPLSFYAAAAGTYSIGLATELLDGLFTGSQVIILKDYVTGIETDLKAGDYTFAAPSGRATTRFVLKYQKNTTVWNGLSWSNGAPIASIEAIIEGVYNTLQTVLLLPINYL